MAEDPDVELMLRFQEGDRRAFELLFQRYTAPLISFLARMVNDRDQAEDLAQEVFVRVYRARDRYRARARFSTWLFGIASHLALNELARARHGKERLLEESDLGNLASPGAGPDEQLDARGLARSLERAITRLPARQRAALLLRTGERLSYDEIAGALATSAASVKSLLHRARQSLLVALKGLEP